MTRRQMIPIYCWVTLKKRITNKLVGRISTSAGHFGWYGNQPYEMINDFEYNMNNRKLNATIKEIERYFGFLYEKGYKIRFSEYSSHFAGNWVIEFASHNCIIIIVNDRQSISIEFSPVENSLGGDRFNVNNLFSIGTMIYFLSKGEITIGGSSWTFNFQKRKHLQRLAELLEKHIDDITPYFGEGFETHKDGLVSARIEYIETFLPKKLR